MQRYHLQKNLVNLEKLASLKVFIAQNILVYIIKIPLVTKTKLEVYKVHEIPIKQKFSEIPNIYVSLQTQSGFIAIRKDEYIRLDTLEFQNCKVIKTVFICENLEPMQKITDKSACDVLIAANREIRLAECNFNIKKKSGTYWRKRFAENAWFFFNCRHGGIIYNM